MTTIHILIKSEGREYESCSHEEALADGFRPVTVALSIRNSQQQDILLNAIKTIGNGDLRIAHNASRSSLTVYRK